MEHQGGEENKISHQGREHGNNHQETKYGSGLEIGKHQYGKAHTYGDGGKDDGSSNVLYGFPEGPLFIEIFFELPVVADQIVYGVINGQTDGNTCDQAGCQ